MKQIITYFIFLFLFIVSGCEEDVSLHSLTGKWEVISLYKDMAYDIKGNTRYVLEFNTDNTIGLMLDVNNCFGNYSSSCDDCISFNSFSCTEICCDNEYSQKLGEVLKETTKYEINFDILTLKNVGEVKLKRVFK